MKNRSLWPLFLVFFSFDSALAVDYSSDYGCEQHFHADGDPFYVSWSPSGVDSGEGRCTIYEEDDVNVGAIVGGSLALGAVLYFALTMGDGSDDSSFSASGLMPKFEDNKLGFTYEAKGRDLTYGVVTTVPFSSPLNRTNGNLMRLPTHKELDRRTKFLSPNSDLEFFIEYRF